MFDAIVNDIKYVEVAHGRYESFMSIEAWRSSGGITGYNGVVFSPTKTGAEEYLSGFKYTTLTDHTRDPRYSSAARGSRSEIIVARILRG